MDTYSHTSAQLRKACRVDVDLSSRMDVDSSRTDWLPRWSDSMPWRSDLMPRRSDLMPRRSDSGSDSGSRSSQADSQTWHRRLGHLNLSDVGKLLSKQSYAETETAPTTCDICVKAMAKENTTTKHFDRSLQNFALPSSHHRHTHSTRMESPKG